MSAAHRLSLQHLLYLQALVEERHVTRAAQRMGIGQPAMSTALARLRQNFSDALLVKTSSGMEPTPRAFELVQRIRDLAGLLEGRGFSEARFDAPTASTHWRIMASDGTARTLLPELIEAAGRLAPQMRFTVLPADPRRIAEHLRDAVFDLAISFVRVPPPELRQVQLYPQRLLCIAREDHPHVQGRVSLKQFVGHAHARWGAPPVSISTMEEMVDDELAALGLAREAALTVSNLTLLPALVAKSDLLAVVPEHMARVARQSFPIQLLTLPFKLPPVNVSMMWHERMHHDTGHRWLRERLREIGRRLGARPSGEDAGG